MDAADLHAAYARIFESLSWEGFQVATSARVRIFRVSGKRRYSADESDFLNSFYANDSPPVG